MAQANVSYLKHLSGIKLVKENHDLYYSKQLMKIKDEANPLPGL
jgi:predicted phosphohydrolase